MYNRYGDMSKFVTDLDLLELSRDGTVCISAEEDYDIAVDLEASYASFNELRLYIALLAARICELDNIVQRFSRKKRLKERGYKCLPSFVGVVWFDYAQSTEDNPAPQGKTFPYDLAFVYLEKPNFVTLDYWHHTENAQLDVVFERREDRFFLRRYGAVAHIPDDWEAD